MTDPTDLFRPGGGDDPLERELRRSLTAHAADAPDAQSLTERLLAAGTSTDVPATLGQLRPRTWRTWGTPLVAAACVAAIVGIVLAIVRPGHSGDGPDAVATPTLPVPSVVTSVPTSGAPTPARPIGTPSTRSVTGLVPLTDVRVVDLTFKSATSGWALASARCLSGHGRCTAVLRTIDGTTWGSFRNVTPFNVPGVSAGCPPATCVSHIRFADNNIGYAFGPKALYLSSDGGQSWKPQTGGADALETLDGNVIRVTSDHSGCPGPCGVRVETSALGGATWKSVTLPGGTVDAATLALARTGSDAFLTTTQGPAGSLYDVVLFTSHDDGAHWTRSMDPCRTNVATSVVTQDLTTAADGSVSVHCAGASGASASIITSTDGGATFAAPRTVTGAGVVPTATQGVPLAAIGAASRWVLIGYGVGGLYRSTDGGHTWRPVQTDTSSGTVLAPGFESSTVGRWVSPDGRTVWTTRDAGATWTKASL